jgi:hypothetical protein
MKADEFWPFALQTQDALLAFRLGFHKLNGAPSLKSRPLRPFLEWLLELANRPPADSEIAGFSNIFQLAGESSPCDMKAILCDIM